MKLTKMKIVLLALALSMIMTGCGNQKIETAPVLAGTWHSIGTGAKFVIGVDGSCKYFNTSDSGLLCDIANVNSHNTSVTFTNNSYFLDATIEVIGGSLFFETSEKFDMFEKQ